MNDMYGIVAAEHPLYQCGQTMWSFDGGRTWQVTPPCFIPRSDLTGACLIVTKVDKIRGEITLEVK